MPHEISATTNLPEELIEALEQVAIEENEYMSHLHDAAFRRFIERWKAGKTARRYYGHHPHALHRTIWMAEDTKEMLRHIHAVDGVKLGLVIQEAFRDYCESKGHRVAMTLPADIQPGEFEKQSAENAAKRSIKWRPIRRYQV